METKTKGEEMVAKRNLCNFKIKRAVGGVEIFIKSELYEDFFNKISSGKAIKAPSGSFFGEGEKYYDVKKCSVPRSDYEYGVSVADYGRRELINPDNASYDFSFIKTVGIKDGVKFTVNGMFLQEDIERLQKDFTKFTKAFFINYAKENSIEVTISAIA